MPYLRLTITLSRVTHKPLHSGLSTILFYVPVNTVKVVLSWSVNLLALFLGKFSPLSGVNLCAFTFASNRQLLFLYQEKGRITVEMINLQESYVSWDSNWQCQGCSQYGYLLEPDTFAFCSIYSTCTDYCIAKTERLLADCMILAVSEWKLLLFSTASLK